jgi:hypothetical protein
VRQSPQSSEAIARGFPYPRVLSLPEPIPASTRQTEMPTPLVALSLKPDTVGLPLRYHLSAHRNHHSAHRNHHSNMLPMAKDEPVAKTSQSTIRILIKHWPPTGGADWPSARAGDGGLGFESYQTSITVVRIPPPGEHRDAGDRRFQRDWPSAMFPRSSARLHIQSRARVSMARCRLARSYGLLRKTRQSTSLIRVRSTSSL